MIFTLTCIIIGLLGWRWHIARVRSAYDRGQFDCALDFGTGYRCALADIIAGTEQRADATLRVSASRHDAQVQAAREGRQ